MKKIFQEKAKIIKKEKISEKYFKLLLKSKNISFWSRPGEFVQIKVSKTDLPLLRRPLGIHRVKGGSFEVLCEIVGEGTMVLSKKKQGEYLDIIGPLGNGFDYSHSIKNKKLSVLVAGGMGVAPLVFLAEKLKKSLKSKSHAANLTLIGARTKQDILCEKEFKMLGFDVKIATDDGSLGFKGKITDLLNTLLTAYRLPLTNIYACGPKPMLKEISRISSTLNIPTQISLEAHMACGIGACLGCVVKTKNGYQRACREGPVFQASEIVW